MAETNIERLAHVLRARYGKEIAELKDELVVRNISSFVIKHSDILDRETADSVVTQHSFADGQVRQALVLCGVPEVKADKLTVRYVGVYSHTPIRDLNSRFLNQMRSFEGIIRRVSEVKDQTVVAAFRCSNCNVINEVKQTNNILKYPEGKCESCDRRVKWELDIKRSQFIDAQTILVQEYPEGLRGGEQPISIPVELTKDLCKTVTPGQRVLIVGTLEARQVNSKDLKLESYIECNSITLKEELYEDMVITDQEMKQIVDLSHDSEIFDKMVGSIAPTIYGSVEVKQGVVLQLFGGVSKIIANTKIRGDIHILLIGDPGIAKSVIMKYVADLSPRGIFTHGNASTKAGLTASAVKDGDEWVLEAGALVLADKGLCAVDELDKMNDQDREALHGAMEQQEIDIAKAGIVARLLCRCSLLAAANPKLGRFDTYSSIATQLNLPATLVSRFDLIYPLMDIPDKVRDDAIADHILKTHTGELEVTGIPKDLFRKYIAHAKSINPTLTKEAREIIRHYYLTVRSQASNMGEVPITARSLEALVRLCEAAARMRLSSEITPSDAELVVRIVDGCLRQIAYDSKTHMFDIDKVRGNYPRAMRNVIDKITIAIHNTQDEHGVATLKNVESYMREHYGIMETETNKYVEVMQQEHILITPRVGLVKLM